MRRGRLKASMVGLATSASVVAVSLGLLERQGNWKSNMSEALHNWTSGLFSLTFFPTCSWLDPPIITAKPFVPKSYSTVRAAEPFVAPSDSSTSLFSVVKTWDANWDLRDPDFLGQKEFPKSTVHLYLIRHGQYHIENSDDADRKLTEVGKKQLELTGQRLQQLGPDRNYNKLIVSTMTRALESAHIISKHLEGVPLELPGDTLLREGAPYPPEPRASTWNSQDKLKVGKKLRNFFEDGPRIEAAFRKYFKRATYDQAEDIHEVIVCHANVIRYFAMRALQLPPEAWLRISLKNGSITIISISPSGRVSLRSLGDAGHLPMELLTTT